MSRTVRNSTFSIASPKLLAALAGLAAASAAHGAMITWTNTTTNNKFDDKLNWNPNTAVPGAADEAVIALANAAATISAGNVTLDKLTINGLASTALIVDGRNLTTKTAGAITKGELRLNAKMGGNVRYTAENNSLSVGNGGTITMDAPVTAGDVTIRMPGAVNGFKVNAGGELRVKPGMGGNRTIDGDFDNAGKLTVDKSLTIQYTRVMGGPGNVFVTNSGTASIAAGQTLRVVGDDPATSFFTMAGGKITNGGNILLEKLSFNYNAGSIRNGADNARGGVNLKEGIWSLNQNTGLFLQVNGDKSVAKTGIPGTDQEVYWNAAGVAAPKMTLDVPAVLLAGQNITLFDNKGKMTFATGGNAMELTGQGLNSRIVNNGTLVTDGNGAVAFKDARFINNKGATLNVGADLSLTTNAAEPADRKPANGGRLTFTRNGATLTTDRTFENKTIVTNISAASKGTIAVKDKTVKASIVTPGGKVTGGDIDLKQITVGAPLPPPPPIVVPDGFTITENLRSAGPSGTFGSFSPATLTFVGGYDQEPDSVFETAILGLSPSTFDVGTIDNFGGLTLGGTMNLFLAGFEPTVGQSFAVARSDSLVIGTFDFGGGVSDLLYPIGGSGALQFRVNYNVPDFSNPGSYLVTLTAEAVPTPGAATLLTIAGLIASRRKR
ncbi:MAG: hypothetical protein ACKVZJ_11675 [Phycisphaerales bacterium]